MWVVLYAENNLLFGVIIQGNKLTKKIIPTVHPESVCFESTGDPGGGGMARRSPCFSPEWRRMSSVHLVKKLPVLSCFSQRKFLLFEKHQTAAKHSVSDMFLFFCLFFWHCSLMAFKQNPLFEGVETLKSLETYQEKKKWFSFRIKARRWNAVRPAMQK